MTRSAKGGEDVNAGRLNLSLTHPFGCSIASIKTKTVRLFDANGVDHWGWRVVIYPNDHRPAHVHVIGAAARRCLISQGQGGPELRENYGFDSKALKRIWAELQGNQAHLIRQWEVIHGTNR